MTGVGSASPGAIVEGHVYGWNVYFGSSGIEPLLGPPAVKASHRASITMEASGHPFCDGLPENCQFQVDQTPYVDAPFHN